MHNSKNRSLPLLRQWLGKTPELLHANRAGKPEAERLIIEQSSAAEALIGRLTAENTTAEVYRIDLSEVISKYIRETQKNLDALFEKAENKEAILYFDEADALFGKRTDVRDSHDRYALLAAPYFFKLVKAYKCTVVAGLKQYP